MKLEYLDDIDGGGKYPNAWPTKLIRLFDFDEQQNQKLIALLTERLLHEGANALVELTSLPFISSLNCRLLLRISAVDKGIIALDAPNSFVCDLTQASYRQTIELMRNVGDGYNWLADASDEDIEFLYSPGGTW